MGRLEIPVWQVDVLPVPLGARRVIRTVSERFDPPQYSKRKPLKTRLDLEFVSGNINKRSIIRVVVKQTSQRPGRGVQEKGAAVTRGLREAFAADALR